MWIISVYLQLKYWVPLAQERSIPFVGWIHKCMCVTQLTNHGCVSSATLSAGQMVQAPFRLKKSLKWPSHALLVDRCCFMTECSGMCKVLACRWRSLFPKGVNTETKHLWHFYGGLRQSGDISLAGRDRALLLSSWKHDWKDAVQGSMRNNIFGSDGHWLLQERFSPLQRAGFFSLKREESTVLHYMAQAVGSSAHGSHSNFPVKLTM